MRDHSGTKILILEDRAIIAADIFIKLLKMNYVVLGSTASMANMYKIVQENRPDIIIMNIGTKEPETRLSGIAALQQDYAISVIVLTAGFDKDSFQKLVDLQPHAIISKPFDSASLQQGIVVTQHRMEV